MRLTSKTNLGAALAGLVWMSSSVANAQNYYRGVPIGDRAIGMGGAYTGLADDPSAAYYNPAGLMRKDVHQFSGGLHLFALSRLRVRDGLSTPSGSQDFDERSVNLLPTFVGFRLGLGKPRHGRQHGVAIAYSTLQPSLEENLFDTSSQETNRVAAARVASVYRMTYYGISVAGATSQKLMLGGSLYLAVQNSAFSEEISVAAGAMGADGALVDPEARVAATRASFRTFHLVPRVGLLYRFNPKWSLGVVVQTPGIPLSQKGATRLQRTVTRPPESGEPDTFLFEEAGGLGANAPIPWELRVGAAFRATERLMLTLDGSVHGRVRDKERIDIDQPVEDVGVFYANSTARRFIGNVALGAEQRFGNIAIQGAFFTNLSAAPSVPPSASRYVPPRINMYGVATALEYGTDRYQFSTGLTFSWGRGDALGAFIDPISGSVRYEAQSAVRRTFIVHVSGVFRAAKKVTKKVTEKAVEEQPKD